MMKMKIVSFEETYNLTTQASCSTAKFRLTDSIKATAFTSQPSSLSGVQIEGDNWSVEHHHPTRDSLFAFKKAVGDHTKIKLSQFIPNNKWFLAPNPAIKLTHTPPLAKGAAVFEASWDTLTRSGGGCTTVYAGKDKEYKASVEMHTKKQIKPFKRGLKHVFFLHHQGVSAMVRAKLRRGIFHAISGEVRSQHGPQVSLKSKMGSNMKLETILNENEIKLCAEHFAPTTSSDSPTRLLSVEATAPRAKVGNPQVVVRMKWNF